MAAPASRIPARRILLAREAPIVVVAPDRSFGMTVHARLRERGRAAVHIASAAKLASLLRDVSIGSIVIASSGVNRRSLRALSDVRSRRPDLPIVLLAGKGPNVPAGPWSAVVRDALAPEQIAAKIESLLPLEPS